LLSKHLKKTDFGRKKVERGQMNSRVSKRKTEEEKVPT